MRCPAALTTVYVSSFVLHIKGFVQPSNVALMGDYLSPAHFGRRAQHGHRYQQHGAKCMPVVTTVPVHRESHATLLMTRVPDPELESIKVDPSTLEDSERERLEGVRMIQSKMENAEAMRKELRTARGPFGGPVDGPVRGTEDMTEEEYRLWLAEGEVYMEKCLNEVNAIQRQLGMRVNEETEQQERELMETAWRGQAGVDKSWKGQKNWTDLPTRKWLAVGDVVALTLFAWVGRASHGMPDFDFWVLVTAFPFYVGWLAVSPLLGAYTTAATASVGDAAKALVPAWGVSIPVAIALRGLLLGGEVPPLAFAVTSMIFTFIALVSWRGLYAAINPTPEEDYNASILDVFRMITMLIQRW